MSHRVDPRRGPIAGVLWGTLLSIPLWIVIGVAIWWIMFR
jgi:hypothetical protein